MPNIQIGNQTIPFPDSGSSPNWSQAVIDFAEAVATQLASISSEFDVAPRVQQLTSDVNTNLPVFACIFPNGSVRSFSFNYAIYRTNNVTTSTEQGEVNAVYDTEASTWTLEHEFNGTKQNDGSMYNTFSMSGDQLVLSTAAIGGSYNNTESTISYFAKTNLVVI